MAATSASNAWAVGCTDCAGGSASKTLILHWNGSAWKRVPSPAGNLSSVAATSARNAWAVGCTDCSGTGVSKTLILHWNGSAWKQAPGPSLVGSLSSVAATPAGNAWAVGGTSKGTLIERWNGTAWNRVPSPNPGNAGLDAVAARSAGSAWAVGSTISGLNDYTLIERWNGTAWNRVPSPNPDVNQGLADYLGAVAVTSAGTPGRSGMPAAGASPGISVTEWWNGTAWKQLSSPSPGASARLSAVTAISARNAWAVGSTSKVNHGSSETLILHWNGTTWS